MTEMIEIPAAAGSAEALLAGDQGRPGVLLFMDAFGLRPRLAEMAERIASWGYLVLAPNVFYRHGRADELAPTVDLREPEAREKYFATGVFDRVKGLTPALSDPDTDAWLRALRERAADGPVGTTGYCMGARLAVRAAGNHPETVAAVGGWHGGGLVTEDLDSPHRKVADARAEFVFGHADNDGSMPPEAIKALGQALRQAGRPHRNEVFAGAAHGYTMSDTSAYDERATERHFTELRDLFARTLGGSPS